MPKYKGKYAAKRRLLTGLDENDQARRVDKAQEFQAWCETPLGAELLEDEIQALGPILDKLFGYHILQLGTTAKLDVLSASPITHKLYLGGSDETAHGQSTVARLCALPFKSDSIDVVVLHHALDFAVDSRAALREAVRVLRPGGHLILICFQPWSLWGLKRAFYALGSVLSLISNKAPWSGRFRSEARLRDWLALLDVQARPNTLIAHGLPFEGHWLRNKLQSASNYLAVKGKSFGSPFGAVTIIRGVKQSRPVTPIILPWRRAINTPLRGVPSAREGYRGRTKVS